MEISKSTKFPLLLERVRVRRINPHDCISSHPNLSGAVSILAAALPPSLGVVPQGGRGKMQNHFIIPFMLLVLCRAGQGYAADNPHEISGQGGAVDCTSCHTEKPQNAKAGVLETKNHKADAEAFKSGGVEMCSGCHNAEDGHKVGLEIDFEVPADLPLDAKNKLTCLTCHYTHGSLGSDRPQASVSFMDSLVDAERLHKSFLLRRNNADGELCLTCHEVKEGSSNAK